MNQDLISRQAAFDELDEQIALCNKALGSFDISMKDEYAVKVERASLKAYRETLNVLPSAQPERKKGEWIEYVPDHGKCPFCGNQVDLLGGKANNFCGECGADMRGEQDG